MIPISRTKQTKNDIYRGDKDNPKLSYHNHDELQLHEN